MQGNFYASTKGKTVKEFSLESLTICSKSLTLHTVCTYVYVTTNGT